MNLIDIERTEANMKRYGRMAATALALAAAMTMAVAVSGCRKNPGLSVNEARANPALLEKTVTLRGVVGAHAPNDPNLFGLMDVSELSCNTPGCNKFFIPVRPEGALPALGAEVDVTGTLAEVPGGKIFAASKVKVVRNHRL